MCHFFIGMDFTFYDLLLSCHFKVFFNKKVETNFPINNVVL